MAAVGCFGTMPVGCTRMHGIQWGATDKITAPPSAANISLTSHRNWCNSRRGHKPQRITALPRHRYSCLLQDRYSGWSSTGKNSVDCHQNNTLILALYIDPQRINNKFRQTDRASNNTYKYTRLSWSPEGQRTCQSESQSMQPCSMAASNHTSASPQLVSQNNDQRPKLKRSGPRWCTLLPYSISTPDDDDAVSISSSQQ